MNPFKEEEGDKTHLTTLQQKVLRDFGRRRFKEIIRLEGLALDERVSPSPNRS